MAVQPMPGTVKALRILLFIIGIIVLISGGIMMMSVLAMAALDSAAADQALAAEGTSMVSMAVLAVVGLAYGIASIVYGALVGKATTAVQWGIIGTQAVYVLVSLLISVMDGSVHGVAILPLVIAILARTKGANEYFSRGSHPRTYA